jgi:hypothetical protein
VNESEYLTAESAENAEVDTKESLPQIKIRWTRIECKVFGGVIFVYLKFICGKLQFSAVSALSADKNSDTKSSFYESLEW